MKGLLSLSHSSVTAGTRPVFVDHPGFRTKKSFKMTDGTIQQKSVIQTKIDPLFLFQGLHKTTKMHIMFILKHQ